MRADGQIHFAMFDARQLVPPVKRSAAPLEIGFARERSMLDLILVAAGLGFFALSVGYAFACDRL
jgi:hypothetical protein